MTLNTTMPPATSATTAQAPALPRMLHVETVATIVGRSLLALLFITAGVVKILHPQPFLEHMAQFGVPGSLLPAVIALELGAGLAILIGWRLRDAAGALAFFCVLTAVIFHHQWSISAERTLFFKDLALAGGLFFMSATGAVRARLRAEAVAFS